MRYCRYISIILVLFISCKDSSHRQVTRGIYYWKTIYNPTEYEHNLLKETGCKKIYLRLFDVDWDKRADKAVPVGMVRMRQRTDSLFEYIPVIFITQDVLRNMRDGAEELAESIHNLTKDLCTSYGLNGNEIRIDCDWTPGTKRLYFELLEALRKKGFFKDKELSCTVRMYQMKYRQKSGIPPVDKVLVMCYNMGNIKLPGARNSIIDVKEAQKFLDHLGTYPKPVDIALPLFGWSLLFRNDKLEGILRDAYPKYLKSNSLFEKKEDNIYQCTADTIWQGYWLQRNDIIRIEESAYRDVMAMAEYAAGKLRSDSVNVLLFHCDSITLKHYTTHELENIYSSFN